jgi:hypothetical protein
MPRLPRLPSPVPARPAGGWQATGWRRTPMLRPRVIGLPAYQLVQGVPLQPASGQALVSSGPTGGPALAQTAVSGTISSGTTLTLTLGAGTTAGNCLIVYAGAVQATTAPTVSGITLGGSGTNAVKLISKESAAGSLDCEIWFIWNIAGGQTSIAVNFNAGSGTEQGNLAWAEEWSGIINTANPADPASSSGTGSTNAWSSGSSGALAQAAELAVGAVCEFGGSQSTITGPSAPWVNETQINSGTDGGLMAGHQPVTTGAAQTYSGTMTASTAWAAVVGALKAVAASNALPAGQAVVQLGPSGLGNTWYPSQVTVATTTSMNQGSDSSVCNIYLGPSVSPLTLLGTVFGGGILAAALPPIQPGQFLIAQWTGANPGDTAAMNVTGTMDALA